MTFLELALRRAGFQNLREFQEANGLYPSGETSILTMQRLEPYFLGFQRHLIRPGDTLYGLARAGGISVSQLLAANPGVQPQKLAIGQYLTVPLPFPVVPTEVPFTYEVLQIVLQGLLARYPSILSARTLTQTDFGRSVSVLRIGAGQRTVLYNAAHHANEWITTPVLMKFLESYAQAYTQGGEVFGISARELFARTTLHLVPMVDPDGVDLVTGAIAPGSSEYERARRIAEAFPAIPFPDGWKANLNGVDLNLNYPAGWEQAREIKFAQGYTQPAPRDYVGAAPLDQRESAAMAELTEQIGPDLTLSYHTQGGEIYWKYQDIEPPRAQEIGRRFAAVSGYTLEEVPYASGFAGYKDWFVLRFGRPGYTVEAGRGVNPLPLSQFGEIYRDNLGILTLGLQLA